jgi:hypothetical protein
MTENTCAHTHKYTRTYTHIYVCVHTCACTHRTRTGTFKCAHACSNSYEILRHHHMHTTLASLCKTQPSIQFISSQKNVNFRSLFVLWPHVLHKACMCCTKPLTTRIAQTVGEAATVKLAHIWSPDHHTLCSRPGSFSCMCQLWSASARLSKRFTVLALRGILCGLGSTCKNDTGVGACVCLYAKYIAQRPPATDEIKHVCVNGFCSHLHRSSI